MAKSRTSPAAAKKRAKRDVDALSGAVLGLIRGTNTAAGRAVSGPDKPRRKSGKKPRIAGATAKGTVGKTGARIGASGGAPPPTQKQARRPLAAVPPTGPKARRRAREAYAQQPVEQRRARIKEVEKKKPAQRDDNDRAVLALNRDRARARRAQRAAEDFARRLDKTPAKKRDALIASLTKSEAELIEKGARVTDRRAQKDTLRAALAGAAGKPLEPVEGKSALSRFIGGAVGGLAGAQSTRSAKNTSAAKKVATTEVAKTTDPVIKSVKTPALKAISQLTRGASATAGVADALTSGRPDKALKEGWKGLIENDRSWEEIARKVGLDGKDAEVAGLLGDIFGDPITYATFGAAGAAKAAGQRAAGKATSTAAVDVTKALNAAKKRGITLTEDDVRRLGAWARRTTAAAQQAAAKEAAKKAATRRTVGGKVTGNRRALTVGTRNRQVRVVTTPAPISKLAAKGAQGMPGRLAGAFSPGRMPPSWRAAGLSESSWQKFRSDQREGRALALKLERDMGNLARLVRSVGDEDAYRRVVGAIEAGRVASLEGAEQAAAQKILAAMKDVRAAFQKYGIKVDLVDTITPARDLAAISKSAQQAAATGKRTTRANLRVLKADEAGRARTVRALQYRGNQTANPEVRAAKKDADAAVRAERGAERDLARVRVQGGKDEASLLKRLNRVTAKAGNASGRQAVAEARAKAKLPRGTSVDDALRQLDEAPAREAARREKIDRLTEKVYDPRASADLIPTVEKLEVELADMLKEVARLPARDLDRVRSARAKATFTREEVEQAQRELKELREELAGAAPAAPRKGVTPAPATPGKVPAARDLLRTLTQTRRIKADELREIHRRLGAVTDRDLAALGRAGTRRREAEELLREVRALGSVIDEGRPLAREDEIRFLTAAAELGALVGRPRLAEQATRALRKAEEFQTPVDFVPRRPQKFVDELLGDEKRIPGGTGLSQRKPANLNSRLERRRLEDVEKIKPGYYSPDLPLLLGLYGVEMGTRLGAAHFFTRVMHRHAAAVTPQGLAEGGVAWRRAGSRFSQVGEAELRDIRKALDDGRPAPEGVFLIDPAVSGQLTEAFNAAGKNEALAIYDKTQRAFKIGATITRPGFFVTTGLGNTWQLYLADSLFTRDWATGVKAFAAMRAAERGSQKVGGRPISRYVERALAGSTVRVGNQRMPLHQLMDEAIAAGGVRGGSRVNDPSELSAFTDAARNAQRKFRPIAAAGQLAEDMDDITKFILFTRGRSKGLTPAEAVEFSHTKMIDYGDLTKFEREVMRRLMPFYVFTSRNLPIQIRSNLQRPGKLANMEKVRQEMADLAGLPEDWEELLLETDQERMPFAVPGQQRDLPLNGGKGQLFQYLRLPTDDLVRPFLVAYDPLGRGVQRYGADLSPLIKIPLEAGLLNRRLDYDRPLDDPEYPTLVGGKLGSLMKLLGAREDTSPRGNTGTVVNGRLLHLFRSLGPYPGAVLSLNRVDGETGGTDTEERLTSSLLLGMGSNVPDPRDTSRVNVAKKIDKLKGEQAKYKEKSRRWYELDDQIQKLYDDRALIRDSLGFTEAKDPAASVRTNRDKELLGLRQPKTIEERMAIDELNVLRRQLGLGDK